MGLKYSLIYKKHWCTYVRITRIDPIICKKAVFSRCFCFGWGQNLVFLKLVKAWVAKSFHFQWCFLDVDGQSFIPKNQMLRKKIRPKMITKINQKIILIIILLEICKKVDRLCDFSGFLSYKELPWAIFARCAKKMADSLQLILSQILVKSVQLKPI